MPGYQKQAGLGLCSAGVGVCSLHACVLKWACSSLPGNSSDLKYCRAGGASSCGLEQEVQQLEHGATAHVCRLPSLHIVLAMGQHSTPVRCCDSNHTGGVIVYVSYIFDCMYHIVDVSPGSAMAGILAQPAPKLLEQPVVNYCCQLAGPARLGLST